MIIPKAYHIIVIKFSGALVCAQDSAFSGASFVLMSVLSPVLFFVLMIVLSPLLFFSAHACAFSGDTPSTLLFERFVLTIVISPVFSCAHDCAFSGAIFCAHD